MPPAHRYVRFIMTMAKIKQEALALPVAQRLSLVQDLWDSIAEDQHSLPLSPEHARILDERLAAHERDPSATISYAQLKRQLRKLRRSKK
jgi:putative addiction module component (TIGR02574 family)